VEVFIILVVAAVAAFYFLAKRGTKAVQAYVYLASRSEGRSEFDANNIALRIDTHSASTLNEAMLMFCKHCYRGKQLAMISSARLDGFKG
jgi:hypothetical protein